MAFNITNKDVMSKKNVLNTAKAPLKELKIC